MTAHSECVRFQQNTKICFFDSVTDIEKVLENKITFKGTSTLKKYCKEEIIFFKMFQKNGFTPYS